MIRMRSKYNPKRHRLRLDAIWNRFCDTYPGLLKKVDEWYPSMNRRILVKLNDGRRLLYDYNTDSYVILSTDKRYEDFEKDILKHEFGRVLDEKLFERDMSNAELGRRVGVTETAVGRYLKGKAIPTAYTLVKIANALGCSVAELIDYH